MEIIFQVDIFDISVIANAVQLNTDKIKTYSLGFDKVSVNFIRSRIDIYIILKFRYERSIKWNNLTFDNWQCPFIPTF